jgi:hypothetical protein
VAHEKRRRAQAKRLRAKRANAKRELWDRSRSGSHAGRGFHYQHRVATEIALEHLHAGTLVQVTPEGLEIFRSRRHRARSTFKQNRVAKVEVPSARANSAVSSRSWLIAWWPMLDHRSCWFSSDR